MKTDTDKFLANIYGYAFFNSLTLLSPVYAVFMSEHGMSDFMVSSLLMLWPVGVLLTQIPLSSVANRIGARLTLVLGQILKIAAFILWILWPCYLGFAIGMLMWGAHGAIYNVIGEDVLYSHMNTHTNTAAYTRALGRRKNYHTFGAILSSFGSLLLFFGYGWITAASILALAISITFIIRMKFDDTQKIKNTNFIASMRTGFRVVIQTPAIFAMMTICVMATNFSYLNDYLGLIGIGVGLPREFIGALPLAMMMCQMLGQGIAHRFTKMNGMWLYIALGGAGMLFMLFALFYNIWALIAIGVAYIICAVVKVILYSRFQDRVPAKFRLEILSIYNLADQFMYMIVCIIIGMGGIMGGWQNGIMILGTLLLGCGLTAALFVRHGGIQRLNKYIARTTIRPDGAPRF